MPGVFISYRRSDCGPWANHLFCDLAREFGSSVVFMDIGGSIPRGAKFDEVIRQSLGECEALLALIGPDWLNCTRDGKRRLDFEDDWVRTEIATALQRKIIVVPVLFGDVKLPDAASLPPNLQDLLRCQAAVVNDPEWNTLIGRLIDDLTKQTTLRRLSAAATSAESGLRLLGDLAKDKPGVVDAVSRSKEVIAITERQLGNLDLLKRIHDSLHTIEAECLRPMQTGGFNPRVRPFQVTFQAEDAKIREAAKHDAVNDALREDLLDQLTAVAAAFQTLLKSSAQPDHQQLVSALTLLLSRNLDRIDQCMVATAREVKLERLIDLMVAVQGKLTVPASGPDAALRPLWDGVEALKQLERELDQRVQEHTLLQDLDSKLRSICEGGNAQSATTEWPRIQRARNRLVPPFTAELSAGSEQMADTEKEISAAVAGGDQAKTATLVSEYFWIVSSVFRHTDQQLLKVSGRLSVVSQPLKAILAIG